MSHPLFIRRAGTLALLAALLVPQAHALSGVSAWAQEGVAAAEQAGLAPTSLEDHSARGAITRAEFCGVAVNTYKAVSGKAVFASGKRPFRDCDDPDVVAAHELGLVNGRGDGIFDPDADIQRQDLCVILCNILQAAAIEADPIAGDACLEDYSDVSSISGYALDAMTTMVDHTVINGIVSPETGARLSPKGTATREQALIMADRFCNEFQDAPLDDDSTPVDDTFAPDDPEYGDDSTDDLMSFYPPFWSFPFDLWAVDQTEQQKMEQVYGVGGEKYQTEEEAQAHMVEIAVPVWRLQPNGTKTSGTAYLEVNANLAAICKEIFEEIYNGEERFPIKNVGGYSWRPGEHAQGTAIDINWEENMEATINEDGSLTPTTGTHWSPGVDPYSIPEGGDVYDAFTKHGFTWGGNAWSRKRDYMHFSYFGR